ncbi:mandelate racemase [Thioalkalivibrio denitrificans]|uniref:Mandelate racemase n=1 Tax=Thioalkalivibrio denitrificans TaxID=108003 RepID=A0A1V3NJY0_9GAMM|nr:enolase C-terminal domain-like protein [Thioalkalivibrio denitrificans]OOG25152.1 mandelate racemase [Thioalkalivibrio denitrificans]
MSRSPALVIRNLRVRTVSVPLRLPLETSGGTIGMAPLVLVDLDTEEGVTGCAYLFCYTPLILRPMASLLVELGEVIQGAEAAPRSLEAVLQRRFRLLGNKGLTAMALAGIDMAAWDALAKASDLSLVRLLGGEPGPVKAYNSCGLGLIGPDRAAEEAVQLLEPGFRAIKVRLGYPDLRTDLSVVRAVRAAVGDDIVLMADYNQMLSVPEAIERIQALADEGLYWIEEPTNAEDYAGHARIREKAGVAIQMGENWWGTREMAKCVAAGASDLVMPDAMKIGGVSGWQRAAAIAGAAGLPVSSHLFPELSVHLLAVTPAAHWLEYADWAEPVLETPVRIEDGHAQCPDLPGAGIVWNEEAVERYLVQ